jgi:hypothetical protein
MSTIGSPTPAQGKIDFGVIGGAWDLFQRQPAPWVVATLVVIVVSSVVGFVVGLVVPYVGGFLGGLPANLLFVGMLRMAFKQIRGQTPAVGDVFDIGDVLVPAIVAWLITSIAIGIGTALCVIPGLIAAGLLLFTSPLVADRRLDGVQAATLSFETLKGELVMASVFALALALVAVVGVLACGVGLLVTLPLVTLAIALTYRNYFPDTGAVSPYAPTAS